MNLRLQLRKFFIARFGETPKRVCLSGNVAKFHLGAGRKVTMLLSRRQADEFVPAPALIFSPDHLADADSLGAPFTVAFASSDATKWLLIDHNSLVYLRDECGGYYGIFGLRTAK